MKLDKEVVMTAIEHSEDDVIYWCDKELRTDREVMLASAKKNGMSLRWANETIKKDKEVLEAAVMNTDGEAFI